MNNLNNYFKSKSPNPQDWKSYPIILRWMQTGRMIPELAIIDAKVGYLFQNSRLKIKEWFSSDNSLTQTTAERYILDHLRVNNPNYSDSFGGNGVDAYLDIKEGKIGLEVTTINEAIAEWILQERLLMFLFSHNYKRTDSIEISYTLDNLVNLRYTLDIVEKIGEKIITQQYGTHGSISIRKVSDRGNYISWNQITTSYNLIDTLKKRLLKILTDKLSQLKKNGKNILFIGVNQLPINELNPSIFGELSKPNRFTSEISDLESIISQSLPDYVLGVCFFVYTLDSDKPMYPLRILWRDNLNQIAISV